jgi:hypothetical protein
MYVPPLWPLDARILNVNRAAFAIVEHLSHRYHFKKEDRIGRHIHINLVHGILGILEELDRQENRRHQ